MKPHEADFSVVGEADPRRTRRIRATCMGSVASRFLSIRRSGSVVAVLGSSFYLGAGDGVVCVGDERIDDGALNLVTDAARDTEWAALGVRPGTAWRVHTECIRIGPSLSVELTEATTWRSRVGSEAWTRARTARALSMLLEMARVRMPADGLGSIALVRAQPPSRPPLLAMAWAPVAALRMWLVAAMQCSGAPAFPVPDAVRRLLGLGPGLTPSGDDLLGGALVALHALGLDELRRCLWDALRPCARASGNAISLAHLAAAAAGHAGASVHALLSALCSANRDTLTASLGRAARHGHTSGWDTLAGIVTTLDAWANGDVPS